MYTFMYILISYLSNKTRRVKISKKYLHTSFIVVLAVHLLTIITSKIFDGIKSDENNILKLFAKKIMIKIMIFAIVYFFFWHSSVFIYFLSGIL